jgi:hypothetical protein
MLAYRYWGCHTLTIFQIIFWNLINWHIIHPILNFIMISNNVSEINMKLLNFPDEITFHLLSWNVTRWQTGILTYWHTEWSNSCINVVFYVL